MGFQLELREAIGEWNGRWAMGVYVSELPLEQKGPGLDRLPDSGLLSALNQAHEG